MKWKISKLGRDLRKIAEKIAASGEKPLTRREIEREVAERRGAKEQALNGKQLDKACTQRPAR